MLSKLLVLILLVTVVESNFWLYPGQSGYTVISGKDSYTEVVVNEPSRKMALVATDDYFIYYNEFGSFHCTGTICAVRKGNYNSMQECALSEVCRDNKCTSGSTTIVYNQRGYPVTGARILNKQHEILKDFKIHNFTSEEAYNRILYLVGYLSTATT